MQYLKQSTAVTVKIGPFLDDTDGKTAETALTIAQADVRLSKNGGDIAQKNEATSCTHDELGIYGCPFDVTDTGTLGRLQLWVHKTGALPVWHEYMVIPANVYDSLFSTDKLEVDLLQIVGVAQSATDLKDFADEGYDPATNKIEGCKVNDDMVGTNNAALASVCTEARLAELGSTNIPADIDTLLSRITAAVALASVCTEARLVRLDATISSRSAHAAADVWAVGTRALTDKADFALSVAARAAVADAIWDEVLTGATHNIPASAGRRLRQVAAFAIHTELAQSGSSNTITLDTGASSVDGIYNRDLCVIVAGTGVGQTRAITEYNGTTKVATVARHWKVIPDDTSEFQILARDALGHPNHGYAQTGAVDSITLEVVASGVDNIYRDMMVFISSGTGWGQARLITAYNGTSKVATVSPDWITTPDDSSVYHVDFGARKVVESLATQAKAEIADAIWDEPHADHTESSTFGGLMKTILAAAKKVFVPLFKK